MTYFMLVRFDSDTPEAVTDLEQSVRSYAPYMVDNVVITIEEEK